MHGATIKIINVQQARLNNICLDKFTVFVAELP